jgi:hypothetical protein
MLSVGMLVMERSKEKERIRLCRAIALANKVNAKRKVIAIEVRESHLQHLQCVQEYFTIAAQPPGGRHNLAQQGRCQLSNDYSQPALRQVALTILQHLTHALAEGHQ